jgi:hypothetical protein
MWSLQQGDTAEGWQVKLGLIVFSVITIGCGAGSIDRPAYNAGDYLAAGVARTLDDPTTKKQIDDLVSSAATSGRDVVLDDKTRTWVLELEAALLAELRKEFRTIILQSKEEVFADLDIKIQSAIEAAISGTSTTQSLRAWDRMREELLGAPLRDDLRVVLSDLDPQLQNIVKQASSNAVIGASNVVTSDVTSIDHDLEKWKWITMTLVIAVFILIFLHAHAVHVMSKKG